MLRMRIQTRMLVAIFVVHDIRLNATVGSGPEG